MATPLSVTAQLAGRLDFLPTIGRRWASGLRNQSTFLSTNTYSFARRLPPRILNCGDRSVQRLIGLLRNELLGERARAQSRRQIQPDRDD